MATSYANNGGTGNRRPEIVVTSTFVSSAGDIGTGNSYTYEELLVLVDGATGTSLGAAGNSRELGNGNNNQDRNFTFDFGVNASIVIDEIKIFISGTNNFGTTFTIEGSNDNSSYTVLKSTFNITGNSNAGTAYSFANSTGYRYYRLRTQGSTSTFGGGTGDWSEFEFKLEDITPQAARCSWFNSGGKGSRSGNPITISTTLTFSSGSVGNLIDGDLTANSSHAVTLNVGQSGTNIVFDFGRPGYVVDTWFVWLSAATGNTQGTWKLQGSPDNSNWTDLESASSLINQANLAFSKHTITNSTGYRYYRLLQVTGSTTGITITEIDFRIKSPGTSAHFYAVILD